MKIEEAIQQSTFQDEYHKLHINILFTASWLTQLTTSILKPFNLSMQQFNILRILKGRRPESATVKYLTERMIDKMSNASRLVEKLKQKGFVERISCPEDRRRVNITITAAGLEIVEEASQVLQEEMTAKISKLSIEEAKMVSDILDKLRA